MNPYMPYVSTVKYAIDPNNIMGLAGKYLALTQKYSGLQLFITVYHCTKACFVPPSNNSPFCSVEATA